MGPARAIGFEKPRNMVCWVPEARITRKEREAESNFVELRKYPERQESGDWVLLRPYGAWSISADLAKINTRDQGPGTKDRSSTDTLASWRQLSE